MALIDNRRQVIEDVWSYPGPDINSAIKANCILSLDALARFESEPSIERPIGVYVPAGTTADQVAPVLARVDLVVVEFPKFRDGRGFTLARTLRGKLGFNGDIRAMGHVLPDQFPALIQCGFSTILLPADHPAEQWKQNDSAVAHVAAAPLLQRLLSGRSAPAVPPEET